MCIVERSENVGRILNGQIPRVCYTIGAIFWALSEPVSRRGGSLVRDPEQFVGGWFAHPCCSERNVGILYRN